MPSSGLTAFRVSYEISPIILNGGIAQNMTGGTLPIVSLLQSQNYDLGVLSSSANIDLDDFFGHFSVLPGAKLVDNQIGHYPFLNQTIAANAIIAQPLKVSLLMNAPAQTGFGGYTSKLSIMTALQLSLQQHTALGGTYIVSTPSFQYTNCLLTQLSDVSGVDDTNQYQYQWRWDFEQPLLTLAQAQAAQNTAMSKISSATKTTADPPTSNTPANAVGQPGSGVGPNVVQNTSGASGTTLPGPQPSQTVGGGA